MLNASTVGTEIIGTLSAYASPFTVAEPILSPVNEPGPFVTAIASISLKSRLIIDLISSSIGRSVSE